MPRPITPDEVQKAKREGLPEQVLEAFNELIVENWRVDRAVVIQATVVERIMAKLGCTREEVFERGWLDIEDVYSDAGWSVVYDKPAYNESYAANFTFSKFNPQR